MSQMQASDQKRPCKTIGEEEGEESPCDFEVSMVICVVQFGSVWFGSRS